MLIVYYVYCLLVDYDFDIICDCVCECGWLWDDMFDLLFKGFLLCEVGCYGVMENGYVLFYLWCNEQVFVWFVMDGCYWVVMDSFGCVLIDMQIVFDVCKGSVLMGCFVCLEMVEILVDVDFDVVLV